MSTTPPGWYPDVETSGGERYWDGVAWGEQRRPAGGGTAAPGQTHPAQPNFGQPQFGQPQYGAPAGYQPYGGFTATYKKKSNSGVALALSISGIFLAFCCGIGVLLAIPGAVMGWQEMKSIDRGETEPTGRGTAKAAFIIGVIVMALGAAFLLLYAVLIALGSV